MADSNLNVVETTMDVNITNPSQLQEVTLDPDSTNFSYMGMRSPGALTGGRSVKEIDEQLTNLRKENFDLKLRIYFLEERIGANFDTDKEDAIKKNIELRVELENIRKDLDEKQELLFQAAKAMEIEEEEKKKEIELRDEQIATLEAKLEEQSNLIKVARPIQHLVSNEEGDSVNTLNLKIKELETELQKGRTQDDQLDHLMDVAVYNKAKYKELEDEMELKDNKLDVVSTELKEATEKLSACNLRILVLEDEISQKCSKVQVAMEQIQQREFDLKQRKSEFKELRKRCDVFQQEKVKWEKLALKMHDDYQTLVVKFQESQQTVNCLKAKLQHFGSSDAGSSLQQVATQNADQEMPQPSLCGSSKINNSNTLQSTTSISPASPRRLQSNSAYVGAGELLVYDNTSETNTVSEFSSELCLSQDKVLGLQKDHFKACKMLKTLIQKKKDFEQDIQQLHTLVAEKDKTIEYLQKTISEFTWADKSVAQRKNPIQEMVTEMKLTACFDPSANKENSMDIEEDLAAKYKELANELEIKIEVLTATVNEKDNQLEQLKQDVQEKANRIIDLEFELLAVDEGVSVANEKEDLGSEKTHDCDKDQQIEKLENELRQRTCDLQGLVNKELWERNRTIEKMQNILKSKDIEINKLEKNTESKDLQLKILKDKINELGVHVNLPPGLYTAPTGSTIATPDNLNEVQDQLRACLEERRNFIKEIEELQNKINNIPEHDENHQLKQLTTNYEDLREELERTEKLRQESHEICLVLTSRLEELCCFLNSLLKQKGVLGFLGSEQTTKLKEVVNRSLDLSQILSTTLLLNPDQSLLQLNNITTLLNSTCNDSDILTRIIGQDEDNSVLSIIPTDVKLTYRSHLNISVGNTNDQEEVIKILRQQVSNLKHEIELRDVELGKKLNEQEHEIKTNLSKSNIRKVKDSDSESWSEPDRTVSFARIGLMDESLKAPSNTSAGRHGRFAAVTTMSTESTEDEHVTHNISRTSSKRTTLAESRQTVISLHEQVCELEEQLQVKENKLLAAQITAYEAENLLKKEQIKLAEMKQEVANFRDINKRLEDSEASRKEAEERAKEELAQLMEQIDEKNKILEEAGKKRAIHEDKICELQNLVSSLEDFQRNMQNLQLVNKDMQNTINELQIEKDKAVESSNLTKSMLEKANKDIETAQNELLEMQKQEKQIREELELNFQANLKNAEEQYINSVRSIERNYEAQTNKCQETVAKMKEEYLRDYIKRSEVDKRMTELEGINTELESLKYFVTDCENRMHIMEAREMDLKAKIQDMQREHHDKIYELHSELDNATLQYSEALLEKTRLQNEVSSLEQKIQNFHLREMELMKEIKEIQNDQNNLHIQIAHLEHQKSLIEIKTCDLQSVNAELMSIRDELQNRILLMQRNKSISERVLSTSLPTFSGAILDLYPNKTLPINIAFNSTQILSDNSGYNSEDVMVDEGRRCLPVVDQDRLHGNSSPDLGIESDHGRFSSMECNANVSRPLLPTLELTQCMNSLLDPIQDITCANDQCCMKTKRISDENVELRKRLLRTRRALEDTLHRLTLANKQKKEVEKSICKQIHQTSQVLRRAKANLDSGSESEVHKN